MSQTDLKNQKEISVQVKFRLPTLPNFIVLAGNEHLSIPIHHASDAELRAIGEAWTEALIERAKRKRG